MINDFATGTRENALIGVTDGILSALSGKKISNIKNNDIKVMGIADTIMRVTHILSGIGKILLIVNMPLILVGKGSFFMVGSCLINFCSKHHNYVAVRFVACQSIRCRCWRSRFD